MTQLLHGLSRYDHLMRHCCDKTALLTQPPLTQTFGYLLGKPNDVTGNLGTAKILHAFDKLVDSIKTKDIDDGPADAGMTFFGQFVDHDVTLEATSSIGKKIDPRSIRNVRTPGLDLDCVYGDGPEASPHLYSPTHHGFLLFGRDDNHNDLARNAKGTALIGDPRNDENILVSQVQGAFICLHNILMSHAEDGGAAQDDIHSCGTMAIRQSVWTESVPPKLMDFEQVRRFVRLHYQWLVLHGLLPAFVDQACIDAALADPYIFGTDAPLMPAEFSVAAYRFGHATVQPKYKLKADSDKMVDLFEPMMLGFGPRTADADIEMGAFFDTGDGAAQPALPVGTNMAETLFKLPDNIVGDGFEWDGVKVSTAMAKKLALRNIIRDRGTIRIASGQQIARWLHHHRPHLGVKELPANDILKEHHISKTPLWFYCLEEANRTGKLEGVGGLIVASVFVRLLAEDPESVLNTDFTPWHGFGGANMTMGRVMGWVEQNRDTVAHREDLRAG